MNYFNSERGAVNPLLISTTIFAVFSIALAGFSVWSFSKYQDYKNNSDQKSAAAVKAANEKQATDLEKQFIEREKQPYTKFNGPDILGHVTFDYPKTWSVYIASDSSSGDYEAYLNPGIVPPVSTATPYALRVSIEGRDYDDVLKSYDSLVKKGTLKSTPVEVNGFTGIRLEGEFTKQRTGAQVVFKIRDKTLVIASDANTFLSDFNDVVIKSLDFNP
jgi:hypothetical protein